MLERQLWTRLDLLQPTPPEETSKETTLAKYQQGQRALARDYRTGFSMRLPGIVERRSVNIYTWSAALNIWKKKLNLV